MLSEALFELDTFPNIILIHHAEFTTKTLRHLGRSCS